MNMYVGNARFVVMYVCIYTNYVYVCIYTNSRLWITFVCVYVCVCIYVYVCMYLISNKSLYVLCM